MSINDDLIKEVLDEMTPLGVNITQDVMRRILAEALVKFVQKQDRRVN